MNRLRNLFYGLFGTLLLGLSGVQAQVSIMLDPANPNRVCEGDYVNFLFTTQNADAVRVFVPALSQLPVDVVVVNPGNDSFEYFFMQAGTYEFVCVASNAMGGTDTARSMIRVFPAPDASFNFDKWSVNDAFCVGTELGIDRWSMFGGFDSLLWDFGDGNSSRERFPGHTYTSSGNYDWKLTVYGQCGTEEYTRPVAIKNDASATPEINLYAGSLTLCPGSTTYISTYSEFADSVRVFTGDGKSTRLDDFRYSYPDKGQYVVKAQAWNQCGMSESEITVLVTDSFDHQASLNAYPTDPCPNQPVNFSMNAIGLKSVRLFTGDGASYTLEGDNYLYQNHQYQNNGIYNVWAEFSYTCGPLDTLDLTVSVGAGARPFPMSLFFSNNEPCPGQQVYVSGFYLQEGDSATVDFGDGNSLKVGYLYGSVSYAYKQMGMYNVAVRKVSACGFTDSAFGTISVGAGSEAGSIYISANYNRDETPLCANDTVTISIGSYFGSGELANPVIKFHDGQTVADDEASKVYSNTGSYLITASAEDVCGFKKTAAYTLDVVNHTFTPSLNYYFYPLANCVHQEFLFDVFVDHASAIRWDFGDGTTMNQPWGMPHVMHAYDRSGTFNVSIEAENGCGISSASSSLHVVEPPAVLFQLSDSVIEPVDTLGLFIDPVTGKASYVQVRIFDADKDPDDFDTLSFDDPKIRFSKAGIYRIQLYAENEFGCWDTFSRTVQVGMLSIPRSPNSEVMFRMYPNPTSDRLFLEQTGPETWTSMEVLDMRGKIISHYNLAPNQNKQEISTHNWASGMYLIRIQTPRSTFTTRLVVVR